MRQLIKKKRVMFYPIAEKDFNKFPLEVQDKFRQRIELLSFKGYLIEPEAKKISDNIFEIRVKLKGAWRAFYSYLNNDLIIILHVISKKTNSTPLNDIKTVKSRLNSVRI